MYVYGACLFYVCCSDCVGGGGLWECLLFRFWWLSILLEPSLGRTVEYGHVMSKRDEDWVKKCMEFIEFKTEYRLEDQEEHG